MILYYLNFYKLTRRFLIRRLFTSFEIDSYIVLQNESSTSLCCSRKSNNPCRGISGKYLQLFSKKV